MTATARRYLRRAVTVVLLGAALSVALRGAPPQLSVSPGTSLQQVVASAPSGTTIRLEPGVHRGPVTIAKRLRIEGPPSAVISAPLEAPAAVTVGADRAVLQGLSVVGGETGIYVRGARHVELVDVTVSGARMEGVDVADAHVGITGVEVRDLVSPLAQGIEIRNSEEHGTITVKDSLVVGGQEGIVSHVSRIRFENNIVRDTTMHAISITEMSRGIAANNTISEAAGAGLYCGDMSLCEFRGNDVGTVQATNDTRSGSGWGLLVHYHSSAYREGDRLEGVAGPIGVFGDSRLRDSSPLRFGEGWRGIAPALWVIPLAILALLGAAATASRVPRARAASSRLAWVAPLVVVGVAVQTFHMLEHSLQVYRVHFDGVPSRGGIAGPGVETEWIHFAYNLVVFGALGLVAAARVRGWAGARRPRVDALLGGAVLLQGYHLVEHGVKVVQHIATGAKVNPGIAGRWFDLVWFHFGINLAVYLGFAIAAVVLLSSRVRVLRAPAVAPATVK